MNPKISIIVPIYNVERYIKKCVDSILAQTFTDFELILVDDGSPDNCGEICDEYAKKDTRIKVIHKENGGLSSARNKGLEIASGDYIGFIDGDDYIDKVMFEDMYMQAMKNSADIVVCDFFMVDEEGTILNSISNRKNIAISNYNNIQSLHQMFKVEMDSDVGTGLNPKWIIMCNKLFRKNLFKKIKFDDGKLFEDELIAHKLLYTSKNIIHIKKQLYYYLQRQNSLSNFPFSIKKFERVYALKKRADFFKDNKLDELHYLALKNYMDSFFWNYNLAQTKIPNAKKDLKKLKRTMDRSLISFIKNPFISWKQKMFIFMFIINPYIFDMSKKIQMKVQQN